MNESSCWNKRPLVCSDGTDVDEVQITALLGKPDKILRRGEGMQSRVWFCYTCAKTHRFSEPVIIPAPCECGGIGFEKREAANDAHA